MWKFGSVPPKQWYLGQRILSFLCLVIFWSDLLNSQGYIYLIDTFSGPHVILSQSTWICFRRVSPIPRKKSRQTTIWSPRTKMEVLNLITLFWRWIFPYISLTYSFFLGEDSSILGTWNFCHASLLANASLRDEVSPIFWCDSKKLQGFSPEPIVYKFGVSSPLQMALWMA